MQDRLILGIFAHVDTGKTTLSEALLYTAGAIRAQGKVDAGNTYLDTDPLERERGITIFSKEARFCSGETEFVLVDTPGHVDFSAEAERALQIPDCAILLIGATDGVRPHTRTLFRLLRQNGVPTFFFVNKTDLPNAGKDAILCDIQKQLTPDAFPFYSISPNETENARAERLALLSEQMLEYYTETGGINLPELTRLIAEGAVFPTFFGSARTRDGVPALLQALTALAPRPVYPDAFGAKVYKILYDGSTRLTLMKVVGGRLAARDSISCGGTQEKVTQILHLSGVRRTQVDQVEAGDVCAVAGLSHTYAGQGLGFAADLPAPLSDPILTYRLLLPPTCAPAQFYPKLRRLAEEDPSLHPVWSEETQELQVCLAGEIQAEILARRIHNSYGTTVAFGEGQILYRETVCTPTEGVGHFEPLRHYAEVHLLLQPLPVGSGIALDSVCPREQLAAHWQNLILECLQTTALRGVLIGAPVTDIKITLLSGRAHPKHTDGGDFREATLRALRQGLMRASCTLLEPYYRYRLSLPAALLGRAIHDLERRHATFVQEEGTDEYAVLSGRAPVACLRGYAREVAAYSGGKGSLTCTPDGNAPCHNAAEIIAERKYSPEADLLFPPHSVFCSHGAGVVVPWNQVHAHMHLPFSYRPKPPLSSPRTLAKTHSLSDEQLEQIMLRTYGPIRRRTYTEPRQMTVNGKAVPPKPRYPALLIDGYNVIFAWDFLAEVAEEDIARAREMLIDLLCNYAAYTKTKISVVFDAYRVPMNRGHEETVNGISVLYTAQGETADAYIEKHMYHVGPDLSLRVVTSDRLIQFSAVHSGILRLSAREFWDEIQRIDLEITAQIRKIAAEAP